MSNIKFVAAKIRTIFGICNKNTKIIFDVALQCCNKEYNNRNYRKIINAIYHNVSRVTIPYPTPMMVEGAYCNVATQRHTHTFRCENMQHPASDGI